MIPTADKVTLSCFNALLMQPLSLISPAPHPPSSSSFPSGVRRDPSMGRREVLSAAFCSIWRRFEGLNKAAKLWRENSLAFIIVIVCEESHCPTDVVGKL